MYEQPFRDQIAYPTNPLLDKDIYLSSNILGCHIVIKFTKSISSLLVAETILSYLEGFLATSLSELMAHTEEITIHLKEFENKQTYHFKKKKRRINILFISIKT